MAIPCVRYDRVADYFHAIGHGRQLARCPPPLFIPAISLIQLGLFLAFKMQANNSHAVEDIFNMLQFDP